MGVGNSNLFGFDQNNLKIGLIQDAYDPSRRRLAVDGGSGVEQAILAGSSFRATSGLITMVQGEHARILLANPVESGVEVRVSSVIFVNSAQTMQATVMVGPDVGVPSTLITASCLHFGYSSEGAELAVYGDVNATAMSGGVSEAPLLIPVGWSALPDGAMFILPEDTAIGLDVEFLAAGTFAWSIYWMEVALG